MSNKQNYQDKLEVINAITVEDTLEPNLPVDTFLQESENLYLWALTDVEKLTGIGISQAMLDDLPVRADACREAQCIWNKDYLSQQEAQKLWNAQSPLAYDMRDELLRTMRYVFRNDATLMGRVRAIAEGFGHSDMVQDLNDLAVLGSKNATRLLAVGFDAGKLQEAATLSKEMATLLAKANGGRTEQHTTKITRDKAYTHLKQLTDEVYAAGKYLFWNDKERIKGYVSSYWRRQKKSKKGQTPSQTT